MVAVILLIAGAASAADCMWTDYDAYTTEGCTFRFFYLECDNDVTCIYNSWLCESGLGLAVHCWQHGG